MRKLLLGLAPAVLLASAAAPALAETDVEDARCVLVMNLVAQSPEQAPQARMAGFYFLGRVDGRSGDPKKLEAIMVEARKGMTSEESIQAELKRCGTIMAARTTSLNEMYNRLQAAEEAAAKAKPE